MKGDFHVRFCERLKLKCFSLLDPEAFDYKSDFTFMVKLSRRFSIATST
jgi:hypothetical protein